MRVLQSLRLVGFVLLWTPTGCRPTAGIPASPTTADREAGELEIYAMMTQSGARASRTLRDSAGRVIRVIYYGVRPGAVVTGLRGPVAERDLMPYAWDTFAYDTTGRLVRDEHVDTIRHLFSYTGFAPDGRRLWRRMLSNGVKVLETRFDSSGRKATELHFDPTGRYLIGIRGEAPEDVDLPHGWGIPVNGLACGIVLTAERGSVDSLAVSINIRASNMSPLHLGELPNAQMSLIDARGTRIPESPQLTPQPRGLYASLHGTIGFLHPPFSLGERFPNLLRGRYTLRVEQPVHSGTTLRCNELPVSIE